MSTDAPRRRGRRSDADAAQTRQAVLGAARRQFAERGFAATTIRSVAGEVGVDPALVARAHGSKTGLFRAALQLPADPGPLVATLAAGPRDTVGERMMAAFLGLAADPDSYAVLIGRVRCAATEPEAAELVRAMIADDIVGPLARALGSDRPRLRAALVSSQIIGWGFTRWVLEIEALQAVDDDAAIELLGPVLQRYLAEPLP